MSLTKLFLARESFVSDIPAEDGKISNHFLQCSDSVGEPCMFARLLVYLGFFNSGGFVAVCLPD